MTKKPNKSAAVKTNLGYIYDCGNICLSAREEFGELQFTIEGLSAVTRLKPQEAIELYQILKKMYENGDLK